MKRASLSRLVLCLALLCICVGCVQNKHKADIPVMYFNLERAAEMIAPWDWACAWAGAQSTLTLQQVDQLGERLELALPVMPGVDSLANYDQIEGCFVDRKIYEERSMDPIPVVSDLFFPTMFHQRVEVVSARVRHIDDVYTYQYNRPLQNVDVLTIREEYTGRDPLLRNWFREYIFLRKPDKETWEFFEFNGIMNIGSGAIKDQLPLREGWEIALTDDKGAD